MHVLNSALIAFSFSASIATASTIAVDTFTAANYNGLLGGLGGNIVSENFEAYSESNVGGVDAPFSTAVGEFETLGGEGSGGTVRNSDSTFTSSNPNDGTQLAIRDDNVFGRVSTTAALTGIETNDKFLDSNDTWGILWDVDLGGLAFTKILLTLTDAADTGATVTITADDGGYFQFQSQPRSNQKTVLIDFGGAVTGATVQFANSNSFGDYRTNDGLALDDIAISAVPLPASFLLLAAGIAGLGAMRRKRKAT